MKSMEDNRRKRPPVKKRKKKRKKIHTRIVSLMVVIAVIVIIISLTLWKGFTLETITVSGNTYYTKEEIQKDLVRANRGSNNTMFLRWKYFRGKGGALPYADSVSVSLKNPHTLHLNLSEKSLVSYVYLKKENKYAYFDEDGVVIYKSQKVKSGTIQIIGTDITSSELFQELKFGHGETISRILSTIRLLKKSKVMPKQIMMQNDGDMILIYKTVQANLGSSSYLNEKIVRLARILPQIEKKKGTLHLETWTDTSTDIYFRKKEWTRIPSEKVATIKIKNSMHSS